MIEAQFTYPRKFVWGHAWPSELPLPSSKKKVQKFIQEFSAYWQNENLKDFESGNYSQSNAHTFLIRLDWPEIQPEKTIWNEKPIKRLRWMAVEFLMRGIIPFVQLDAHIAPNWFLDEDGWSNQKAQRYFQNFFERVTTATQDVVLNWVIGGLQVDSSNRLYALANGVNFNQRSSELHRLSTSNFLDAFKACSQTLRNHQTEARLGIECRLADPGARNLENHFERGVAKFSVGQALDEVAAGIRRLLGHNRTHDEYQDFLKLNFNFAILRYQTLSSAAVDLESGISPPSKESEGTLEGMDHIRLWQYLKWFSKLQRPFYLVLDPSKETTSMSAMLAIVLRELWRAANFNWQASGFFYQIPRETQPLGSETPLLDSEDQWGQRLESIPKLFQAVSAAHHLSAEQVRGHAPAAEEVLFPD